MQLLLNRAAVGWAVSCSAFGLFYFFLTAQPKACAVLVLHECAVLVLHDVFFFNRAVLVLHGFFF